MFLTGEVLSPKLKPKLFSDREPGGKKSADSIVVRKFNQLMINDLLNYILFFT